MLGVIVVTAVISTLNLCFTLKEYVYRYKTYKMVRRVYEIQESKVPKQ